MAKFKVSQFLVTLGPYRLSQDINYVSLPTDREDLDASGLEDVVNQHDAGALSAMATIRGVGSDTLDAALIDRVRTGAADTPLLLAQNLAGALASQAWITEGKVGALQPARDRQQLEQLEAPLWLSRAYQRGSVLYNWLVDGIVAATADGAGVQRGALAAGELLLCVQVVPDPPQATGTGTLDTILESSALGNFTDAVTRHSFTQVSAGAGSAVELAVIDGDASPVTDEYWRLGFTVAGGGAPQFPVLAALAIAAKV